jgi:HEAT repeat protein
MNEQEWVALQKALRDAGNVDGSIAAAEELHKSAVAEDLPRLMSMLADPDFFVREAVAWPISELAGASALPALLAAYQRGLDDGHDNDGFSAALIELVAAHRAEAQAVLEHLAKSGGAEMRINAEWLLEFCADQRDE